MVLKLEAIASELEDARGHPKVYEVFSYPADFTLQGLYDKWENHELIIPKFQRKFVWKLAQASKLIESFLMGLPVPEIFLYKTPDEKQIIIDGQQRLVSVFSFFDGHFPDNKPFALKGVQRSWEGKTYDELDSTLQRRLRSSVLRSIFVQQVKPRDRTSIYHVFQRLNTGGTTLTPQEVRNCVYQGRLNDLLVRLNRDDGWRRIMGVPTADKRMRDVELIARFFALAEPKAKYSKPMKDFISSFMALRRPAGSNARLEKLFRETVAKVLEGLGSRPFHLKRGLNAAVFDAVMVAFAANRRKSLPADIRQRYSRLKRNAEFAEKTTAATTDVDSVNGRIKIARRLLFS